MRRQPSLLIVEDDLEIASMVATMLRSHGFITHRAADAASFDRLLAREQIDLTILDLMLPGEGGLSLCRRLRRRSNMPILMLTALGSEADRVIGLESGADDYLVKPFAPRELLARVRALLRRTGLHQDEVVETPERFSFDGYTLDLIRLTLTDPAQVNIPVTSAEFALLVQLCRHAQQVLSREKLLELLHGESPPACGRSIDTLVARLRRKIEDDAREPRRLKTVRLGGYYFAPAVSAQSHNQAA